MSETEHESAAPGFSDYVATCSTAGCQNEGVPISASAPTVDPGFFCGPCGEPISTLSKLGG